MLTKIAALLSTLNETGGSPESMLYIFFDMNMDVWTKVKFQLIQAGLISVKGYYVTLTELGRETALKIDSALRRS